MGFCWAAKKGLRGGRGGVGGGQGEGERGGSTGLGAKSGKVCKVCLPLRAGSASSMKNKMRAAPPPCGLSGARFLGLKGGKKGGFTSDSSNTPLGRRTLSPETLKPKSEVYAPQPESLHLNPNLSTKPKPLQLQHPKPLTQAPSLTRNHQGPFSRVFCGP